MSKAQQYVPDYDHNFGIFKIRQNVERYFYRTTVIMLSFSTKPYLRFVSNRTKCIWHDGPERLIGVSSTWSMTSRVVGFPNIDHVWISELRKPRGEGMEIPPIGARQNSGDGYSTDWAQFEAFGNTFELIINSVIKSVRFLYTVK